MLLQAGFFLLIVGAIVHVRAQIVGGCEAPDHKYPYMVSFRDRISGAHFCAGAIISISWILSAAHCFAGRPLESIIISVGTNYLDKIGVVHRPQSIHIPPGYVNPWSQDIALIRVKNGIVSNGFVATIALPADNLKNYNQAAVFTGWGSIHNISGKYPNALHEIKLNMLSMDRCKPLTSVITDAHICSLNDFGSGVCYGDSGGPLVINGEVVGIGSRMVPCARNFPDIFTRVWSYKIWIVNTITHN